ncbi:splicing factor, suppressor of white-apricot homolog isoform X2 [Physella acuta]|uniref:splicing factor, suppressor of white-apricot homolog isoform X2 n=1 Tax=Physella acuta TaxID=109671 RepID=UPI0027DCAAE9|nr:splicing factor, suppressor of white-apricot homolog isoform X2 [Physella acuta]
MNQFQEIYFFGHCGLEGVLSGECWRLTRRSSMTRMGMLSKHHIIWYFKNRYDGRGHLYDLAAHDSEKIEDKNPALTEEEEAIEKACEEERYLELHTDLREAQIYEEEEWKRYYLSLQEGYKAVGFSYDEQYSEGQEQALYTEPVKEEDDKPFVPSEELQLPSDIQLPKCGKHNARIEKTANFIAQHGIQMEIMLKTKQAGNPQFDFLHFENELNPYYKHVLGMIKSGKYKPTEEEEDIKKEEENNHSYLHPSLSSLSSVTQLPPPPPPPSKPIELPKVSIHDTPYGALVKSIRQNTETSRLAAQSMHTNNTHYPHVSEYQSYYHNPPPPGTEPVTLPIVSSLNGQEFVNQLYRTEENNGDSVKKRKKRSSSSDSSGSSSSSSSSSPSTQKKRKSNGPKKAEGPCQIVTPPPDVQPIVDRMAMYVAKNGAEFEMVVMNRKDPRFQFLNEFHAHYPYYKLKKERFMKELGKTITERGDTQEDKASQNLQRSVSFSIKARPKEQESSQQPGKPWLFEYDSSEGDEEKPRDPTSETLSGSATPTAKVYQDEDTQKEMEEKLKDKLASAVKERISQTHKEKQLQMERKRKAALFLNQIKTTQPSAPLPNVLQEDSSSLYVGETTPSTVVFDYDNQPVPQILSSRYDKSRSSRDKKRRRRSPTPPSAYNLERRSPNRPSPSMWLNRPTNWSAMRDRTPPWQRRNREIMNRRSRSPYRKEEKKKHKRSKSRSPLRREKPKDKSRHSKERTKHRSKEKEKKKKEKSRHRSKDRDSKPSVKDAVSDGESSDVEIVEKSPSELFPEDPTRSSIERDILSAVKENTIKNSESTDDLTASLSRTTSQCNSPATQASVSRGSTPSRSSTDLTSAASSDLMSKVRAMLKKSREMIRKEEGLSLEDT